MFLFGSVLWDWWNIFYFFLILFLSLTAFCVEKTQNKTKEINVEQKTNDVSTKKSEKLKKDNSVEKNKLQNLKFKPLLLMEHLLILN